MNQPNGHFSNGDQDISTNGVGAFRNGSANGRSSLPIDWEHLARATAHPMRVSIMEILGMDGGRTLSPNELSQELQIPLSNTNYHVTELAKVGLIKLTHQHQVRGATEHFYRVASEDERNADKQSEPEPASANPTQGD